MSYISAIRKGEEVLVWERTEAGRDIKIYPAPFYFYIPHQQGEYVSIYGDKLTRINCANSREFYQAKAECDSNHIKRFESDIPPELKVLSKNYYNVPAPNLNITLLDIEVDYRSELGFASIENPYAPINSVALYHVWSKRMVVYAVPPEELDVSTLGTNEDMMARLHEIAPLMDDVNVELVLCKDERELLMYLLAEIEDSDIISGWNSDFFDVPYIGKRLLNLGKKYFRMLSFDMADEPKWREMEIMGRQATTLDLSGRVRLDYLDLFKKYEQALRPSYKLESVAAEILPDLPKLEYEGSLAALYRRDFMWFVRYNLRDTEILKGFEDRLGYIDLANQMCHLSTALFQHVAGTLKLVEYATINYCHHELGGLIVNDLQPPDIDKTIQGAFVLTPKAGMHEWIGSIDINSLYPSSIRSINISKETIIGQFTDEGGAVESIAKGSDDMLTFVYETGQSEQRPADEWKALLKESKWAVSGYGTVFDQNKQGVIPAILEDWYATRKKYQKLKAEHAHDKLKETYYDKLQYVYKIKLNSFYGALSNLYFRFYDLRMGESTTGTGRMILKHQCAKTNEILTGEYDVTGDGIIYGDSVAGDTLIETPEGPRKIEDMFTEVHYSKGTKQYSNCSGKALTFNPDTKRNEFRDIKYVVRHNVNKKMYRVWIGNTRYVDVTEDHSLIGFANTKSTTPGLVEVKPQDIGNDNVNSLLLCKSIPNNNSLDYSISDEMYQLIGYVIGDGHVEIKKESGVGISVGKQDKQEIIEKLIRPLIEQGWFTSYIEMRNGHDIRLCGVAGWKKLRSLLYPIGHKQFPEDSLSLSPNNMRNILKGYFSADGFANVNKTVGLCSTNYEFIDTAHRMLKLCGIASNYWTETTENSFNGKYSNTYTRRLTVYDAVKFGQDIGFIQHRKNKNVRTCYSRSTSHTEQQSGYALIRPTKIEEISVPEYVYDIEVDGTHTFYANDLLVHNTDSTYFETWAENQNEAVLVSDKIADLVNESFPDFMRDTFLCNPGFDDIIKAGREIVSDRGIFVDKKRYILHLVDLDGRPVDKLKVMGLDTKKTTLPAWISAKLNGFIERHLKGEEWDVIKQDIVDFKSYIETTDDIMSVGLPKGVKGVEKYTTDLRVLGEGARLPGHVAASIFYNLCLEKFEDKESVPIYSGMKIKVFYLKKKVGRFKAIAIPVDIEQVPSWFFEKFEIDREAHIERLVDKPLQNILKAIDQQVPSKQSMLADSFLEF